MTRLNILTCPTQISQTDRAPWQHHLGYAGFTTFCVYAVITCDHHSAGFDNALLRTTTLSKYTASTLEVK